MQPPPTDWSELDGSPLSERENKMLRALLLERERTAWVRRRMGVILPWLAGAIAGAWALFEWVLRHISWRGQ